MGAGHSHDHGALRRVPVATGPRAVLLGTLAVLAVATIAGLVLLWPSSTQVDEVSKDVNFAAPGVTFPHADVTDVLSPCVPDENGIIQQPEEPTCGVIDVRVTTGETSGDTAQVQVLGPVSHAGLQPGDSVQLMRIPAGQGDAYVFFGVDRDRPIALMAVVFVIVVAVVARLRGILALVGLVISGAVLVWFMLPALLIGENGVLIALVGSSAIMFVVLYLAHGPSTRTSAALAGTLIGVGLTALLAELAVAGTRLNGVGDEAGARLNAFVDTLDFQGLLTCAIIVAGLGVLNDVTITQSSAVWELRAAGPELSRRELYRRGMRIGRDHIASTIYTIVFAYAGAALAVLLLLFLYDLPTLDLLGTEDIGTEVVRTLCSAIGLVLAVPVTTAIAALTVAGASSDEGTPYQGKRRRD